VLLVAGGCHTSALEVRSIRLVSISHEDIRPSIDILSFYITPITTFSCFAYWAMLISISNVQVSAASSRIASTYSLLSDIGQVGTEIESDDTRYLPLLLLLIIYIDPLL
jgi:hypothetical protein